MGSINLKHTGSGSAIALSSDGTNLLLDGTAIGGGGGGSPDLYAENYVSGTKPDASSSTNGVAIGRDAISTGSKSIAIGTGRASGAFSIAAAIGNNTTTYGASNNTSIAIGYNAKSTNLYATAIGYGSHGNHSTGVAIGRQAVTTASNQVALNGTNQPVKISGVYTLPTADGTNGQVMTTDGSGAVSWAAGGGGGAYEFIASTGSIANNTASVIFDSSHFNSGSYRNYVFKFANVKIQSDSWYLQMHVSYNDGTSYETGNIYKDATTLRNFSLLTQYGLGTATNESGLSGEMLLYNPHDTSAYTYLLTQFIYTNNSGSMVREHDIREPLHWIQNTSSINNIKITVGSGNFASGYIDMYGIKKA